jgi:hypothetical protein
MAKLKNSTFNVFYFFLTCYVSANSSPIAITSVTSDLEQAKIDLNEGGSLTATGYEDPLMEYMLQQSGLGLVAELVRDDLSSWTDHLPGASISVFSENGLNESVVSATVSDGTALAFSSVSSYKVFDVQDVSSITFSVDATSIIDLEAESYGDFASSQWFFNIGLYGDLNADGNAETLLDSKEYWSGFFDAFDGNSLNLIDNQKLSISYNPEAIFNGTLKLQCTLTADAYVEITPPIAVPEPSAANMIVVGLAVLLPLVRFRKK